MTIPRRGRPRLDPKDPEPSSEVHVRISSKQYDSVYAIASGRRITVSELVRQALADLKSPRHS
jgi:hypothetical protein